MACPQVILFSHYSYSRVEFLYWQSFCREHKTNIE